jgi:hypothetical protein
MGNEAKAETRRAARAGTARSISYLHGAAGTDTWITDVCHHGQVPKVMEQLILSDASDGSPSVKACGRSNRQRWVRFLFRGSTGRLGRPKMGGASPTGGAGGGLVRHGDEETGHLETLTSNIP